MPALLTGYAEASSTTMKFVRRRLTDGAFWNTDTVAFESFDALNIADYGIAATETGTATGIYTATDPAESTAGDYLLVKAAGAELAVSDLASGLRWQSDGAAMTLANGAITEATITTPAETAGRPTGILGMIRRLFEGRHNKRTRNRTSGVVAIRNAADDGNLEAATQASGTVGSDTVDSISQGA